MDVSSFLGGSLLSQVDLAQPYQVWTISKVDQQKVGQGADAETKVCTTFSEHNKPLALNKTNLKRCAELYTTDANHWIGKQLLVYRSSTTFGGQRKLCVRVCGPQQAPAEPICESNGNPVPFQSAAAQPAAAEQPAPQPPAQRQSVAAPQPQASQQPPWGG